MLGSGRPKVATVRQNSFLVRTGLARLAQAVMNKSSTKPSQSAVAFHWRGGGQSRAIPACSATLGTLAAWIFLTTGYPGMESSMRLLLVNHVL